MHANLKGFQGIKGLLLRHCEKIGVLAVALCAILFIWSSLGHEPLPADYQPAKLQNLITETRQTIQDFDWEDVPAEDKREVVRLTANAGRAVSPDHYKTSPSGMNRPVVAPSVLRTDPLLLAALDVQVHSGAGLLAFADKSIKEQRALERAKEEARRERERQKQQQRQQDGADRGRGEEGMYYGREMGRGGMEPDPENPNRRPLVARIRPEGIPLRGDERIDEVHWAVVVAKVPVEDQLKLYQDALANTRQYNPAGDCPQYVGYRVERAEVRRGAKLEFRKIYDGTAKRIGDDLKDWAQFPPEVIDNRYYNSILTYPLPPLVGRDWQYDVTHSEIPLAVDVEPEVAPELVEEEEDEAPADGETQFLAESDALRGGPMGMPGRDYGYGGMDDGGRGYGGYEGRGEYGMMMEGGRESYDGGYGMMSSGGEYGGYGEMMSSDGYGSMRGGYGGRSAMGGGRGPRSIANAICMADVPYHLFRFFDFTVKPGKAYKYRVRLVLLDVNHQVAKSALDNTVVERLEKLGKGSQPIRWTEWSEPSPPVSIPIAGSVRVAAAQSAGGSANDEPEVKLLVQAFDVREGHQAIQTGMEWDFRRGSVANLKEDAEYVVGTRFIDKIEDFEFVTDITVVDIDGGDKLSRRITEPARVLLMDAAGRLFIRDELSDRDEVEYHKTIFAEDKRRRGRGRGMDERGMDAYGGEYSGRGIEYGDR